MAEKIEIIVSVVDQASQETQKIASTVKSNLDGASKAWEGFSAATTVASFGVAAALGKVSADMLTMGGSLEQARIGFETLTGSGEKATKMMSFLQDIALKSPLDMSQTIEGSRRLLAYGMSAEQVMNTLPKLVDTVSALGIEGGRANKITLAMGQIFNSTTMKGQEMRQMTEAGVPIIDMLAKAIQNGTVHADGLSKGFTTLGGASKKLSSDNAAATQNIGVLSAQIKVQEEALNKATSEHKKSNAELDLMRARLNAGKAKLSEYNGAISEYGKAHESAGKKVAFAGASLDEIKSKLNNVADLELNGKEVALALWDAMGDKYAGAAEKQVKTFTGQLSNTRDVILLTAGAMVGFSNEGVRQGSILNIVTEALTSFNDTLSAMSPQMVAFTDGILKNKVAVQALAGVIFAMLVPALIFLGTTVGTFLVAIAPFAAVFAAVGASVGILTTLWDQNRGAALGLTAIFIAIQGAILSFAIPAIGAFTAALTALAFSFAAFMLTNPIGWLILAIGGIGAAVYAVFPEVREQINTTFSAMILSIQNVIYQYDLFGQRARDAAQAQRDMTQAVKEAKDADDALEGSSLRVEGAKLALERATKNASDAHKKYKEGSLEVRDADHQVKIATNDYTDAKKDLAVKIDEASKKEFEANEAMKKSDKKMAESNSNIKTHMQFWNDLTGAIGNAISKISEYVGKAVSGPGGVALFQGMSSHAHGGIVPGSPGQPVPILAHGGERVVPMTGMDVNSSSGGSGSGLTINITGPVTMDSPDRVQQLAVEVQKILGRQNELARMGVGY